VNIRHRLDLVGTPGRDLGDQSLMCEFTLEKRGCGVDTSRAGACPEHNNRDILRSAVPVQPQHRNDPSKREVPMCPRAFEYGVTVAAIERKANLGEHLL
jgi:hypothetical protein